MIRPSDEALAAFDGEWIKHSPYLGRVDLLRAQLKAAYAVDFAKLEEEIRVAEALSDERQKVLDAIPECKPHGKCVPHALEWINEVKYLLSWVLQTEARRHLPSALVKGIRLVLEGMS